MEIDKFITTPTFCLLYWKGDNLKAWLKRQQNKTRSVNQVIVVAKQSCLSCQSLCNIINIKYFYTGVQCYPPSTKPVDNWVTDQFEENKWSLVTGLFVSNSHLKTTILHFRYSGTSSVSNCSWEEIFQVDDSVTSCCAFPIVFSSEVS